MFLKITKLNMQHVRVAIDAVFFKILSSLAIIFPVIYHDFKEAYYNE